MLNRRTRTVQRATVRPYEVIRTAALALDKAVPTPALVQALAGALERISAEQCETSRDTRLALIERLAQLGSPAQASTLTPLLKDLDPKVAQAAAKVVTQWTGKVRGDRHAAREIDQHPDRRRRSRIGSRVVFEMDNGRSFDVQLDALDAPLARTRFLAAVARGYYNNLTFHRVVPNFVIQGGSPGANEYCGDCPFMRDEVGGMHERGTIGISTRGPDTGDAQIFINLVDNPRLDFDYTVFARVCTGMTVVDEIAEGDRIAQVQILPPSHDLRRLARLLTKSYQFVSRCSRHGTVRLRIAGVSADRDGVAAQTHVHDSRPDPKEEDPWKLQRPRSRKTEQFSEKTLQIINDAALALMMSIGHRTRLFDTMADLPAVDGREIAEAAGLNERYVREWLGAMVTGGIVEYDAGSDMYRLPPEHAAA